jgi:ricin-type beta-trefoil lectin protein
MKVEKQIRKMEAAMSRYAKFVFTLVLGAVLLVGGRTQQAHAQTGTSSQALVSTPPLFEDRLFLITNVMTGEVLDVPGASTKAGEFIQQFPLNSGKNQMWKIIGRCEMDSTHNVDCDGYVNIMNINSNLVLDVPSFSTLPGVQIAQYYFNGGRNQQWQLVPVGKSGQTNVYMIYNRNSRKYLDIFGGILAGPAAPLVQKDFTFTVPNPTNPGGSLPSSQLWFVQSIN